MTYRLALESDKDALIKFVEERKMQMPDFGTTFIAVNDAGEIVGMANGGLVPYIETLISDNPMATTVLFAKLEGSLEVVTMAPILSTIINPAAGDLLEKAGYKPARVQLFIKRR